MYPHTIMLIVWTKNIAPSTGCYWPVPIMRICAQHRGNPFPLSYSGLAPAGVWKICVFYWHGDGLIKFAALLLHHRSRSDHPQSLNEPLFTPVHPLIPPPRPPKHHLACYNYRKCLMETNDHIHVAQAANSLNGGKREELRELPGIWTDINAWSRPVDQSRFPTNEFRVADARF